MASTKEKMQKAQQLIKEKRYDEARAILRTVEHDKAYEWLDKLDKIALPKPPAKIEKKHSGGCIRRIAVIVGSVFLVLCGLSLLVALLDNDNREVLPTSVVIPSSTTIVTTDTVLAASPLAQTSTPLPSATPDAARQTFQDDVLLHVDNMMVVEHPDGFFALNEISFVLLAEIENTSSRRDCLYARDIRLILDGEEYAPDSTLMDRLMDVIGRDFTGAFTGHCVEAGQSALTFSAFDVPINAGSVSLRFREDTQTVSIPWQLEVYPQSQPLAFDDLPALATEGFIAVGTQSAAATMTATLWTQTPTPTNTPTPIPSPTDTPEDMAIAAFSAAISRSRVESIETLVVNDIVVTIRFPLSDLSAGAARSEIENLFPKLVCELKEIGLTGRTYQLTGTISLIDAFGNTSIGEGVEMIIPAENVARLNCDESTIYGINLSIVAERYDIHPALQN
jgi:hypothetical protein